MNESPSTLGVIIGNRDFFPDQLVAEARQDILKLFGELNIKPIMVSPEDTKLGGVETHADARKCADLFQRPSRRDRRRARRAAELWRRKRRGRHAEAGRARMCPC